MDETTENMLEEDLHAKTLLNKMQDFFSNKQVYNFFCFKLVCLSWNFHLTEKSYCQILKN